MPTWSFCGSDGLFTGASLTGSEDLLQANTPPGCVAIAGHHDHASRRVDLETGQVVPYMPPAPDDTTLQTWSWNEAAERWVSTPTLAAHQAAAWERIKAARAQAEQAPIVLGPRTFDADALSQQRIAGAVQMAQLALAAGSAASWSITWTLADNTAAELTSTEMLDLGMTLAAQISQAHGHGRRLREQINAASSLDELNNITWN